MDELDDLEQDLTPTLGWVTIVLDDIESRPQTNHESENDDDR